MTPQSAVRELETVKQFFDRATSIFTEEHSSYKPYPGMFTVAQQVAHCAQVIDWFVQGAFRPEGFDMDFESMHKGTDGVTSLEQARAWFHKSIADAQALLGAKTAAQLAETVEDKYIMPGAPRYAIIGGIADHTAHHRGALAVYTRGLGLVPPMPYM